MCSGFGLELWGMVEGMVSVRASVSVICKGMVMVRVRYRVSVPVSVVLVLVLGIWLGLGIYSVL